MKIKHRTIDSILSWAAALAYVAALAVAVSLAGCSSTKTIKQESAAVQVDSTYIKDLESKLDSSRTANTRLRSEKEHIREELETAISGSSGERDTIYPEIPVQSKRLTAGEDYVDLSGQWLYLDYYWHRAPRTSTEKETFDSTSVVRERFRQELSKKENSIASLQQKISSLESKEKKKVGVPILTVIIIALSTLLLGIILGKFFL